MKRPVLILVALLALTPHAFGDWNIHVAPNGSIQGDGSIQKPFQNLTQARNAIRAKRKSSEIASDEAIVVQVGPGVYRLDQSFELTAIDSGTSAAPVIYRSTQPGTAQIHGGESLQPSAFVPVTNPNALKRLSSSAQDQVRVCEVQNLNGDVPDLNDSFRAVPAGPWLFINGQPQELARWPNANADNAGWTSFTKAIDSGMPQPDATDEKLRKLHPGSFQFDDPRPASWDLSQGVWLRGYWTHDWSDEVIRVATYDQQAKVIGLAKPHSYGINNGTWGRSERRFYAVNVFEELDAPGEWYLDRKNKQLYLIPPADFSNASVVLATLQSPLVKMTDAHHIHLEGLSIQYGHSDAISIRNANHIQITNCEIANHARSAISLHGSDNIVSSCHVYNLGTSGISVKGGDRNTLTPGNNLVVNNHIHHYGKFQRTYAPGISLQGCGQIARNNCIHDAPHNAVHYGGNDHLFERNEVYRVVMETGDSGAFYSGRDWTSQGNVIRHNYIHDLGESDSTHTNTMGVYLDDCDSGDTIEGNVFYRAGRAIMIGGGRDNPVLNNLVIDCPIGIHLDSRGMTWEQWNNPKYSSWQLERKAEALNYLNPPWSDRYPWLAEIMNDSPREPLHNPMRGNVFINVSKEVCHFDAKVRKLLKKLDIQNNIVLNTPGSATTTVKATDIDGFTNWDASQKDTLPAEFNTNFSPATLFHSHSGWQKKFPSIASIPFDEIGLIPNP
ncbi:Right handed beta helix region [Neorhodopirellula lusitana]|uniref:Right handed beta helix region n=1 Tax=Neorhodopirellula lusitana TaxID=445327 RepID=A0ABY1QHJ4_9BACT|nr:right-handed parallel beta-helix repeat-containing protein [Neorhodopirellula lusitana]SMP68892.1 Right handed beta helix region [Neorhodopirellula lusitana]